MLPSSGQVLNHSSCHLGQLPSQQVQRMEEETEQDILESSLRREKVGRNLHLGAPPMLKPRATPSSSLPSAPQSALHNMRKSWSLWGVLRRSSPL